MEQYAFAAFRRPIWTRTRSSSVCIVDVADVEVSCYLDGIARFSAASHKWSF